ncbi:tRNA pseudouridine(55) synthase TruB [Nocardioides sambongensis]|uniref:tRNA pseudouridine(55) synthase TruB n=1 Tax=Nocardioides sambongensis TaxID=2589074 RepID=UPI00112BB161|nr:tRNA pseudouridine(55) synthase TruB [Nocardioides sambongensis]
MSRPAASGLVVVDKPAGITSHGVVARVRRLAGTRKVGHAGTLDPMATGVLVLGINRATRLLGHLMLTDKVYQATVRLGSVTTTDDAEGEPVSSTDASAVDEAAIRAALATQVGEIDQVPTAVSAIKVDGKRAYQRVRDGEDVELAARRVRIDSIDVGRVALGAAPEIDITVRCSSGTYIRAIARDTGALLGVGGHLTALRRTAVGGFGLDAAHTLAELEDDFALVPLAAAARATFPAVDLSAEQGRDVRYGRSLDLPLTGLTAVFDDGEFLALYEPRGEQARPVAVFVG